ncbi:MAG: hypothetical protein H6551_05360 [Chitinophagales bacterium]|nr:hypothetical protein [Chitinophagaceae bacterium]MCB9064557.1 hypothetical protein [Chitinophagales bacterium]
MTQTVLKSLRVLIPGLLIYMGFVVFFSVNENKEIDEIKLGDYNWALVVALVFGGLYHMLNVRHLITNRSYKQIDLNIKNSLLKIYDGQLSDDERKKLIQNNSIKNIFYKIIDNDESLKKKSQQVYFNGLFWTSTADAFIISIISSLIYFISAFVFHDLKTVFISWSSILLLLTGISYFLHLLSINSHIKLSNDQLSYIEQHYAGQVNQYINELL